MVDLCVELELVYSNALNKLGDDMILGHRVKVGFPEK